MNSVILAIDCGTQSLRTLLFSPSGELLDRAQVFYEPYFSVKPGWAEQDPEVFWNSFIEACAILKANDSDLFGKIACVGVTTQRASMINVDRNGTPLRPAIIWLDQRKAKENIKFRTALNPLLQTLGLKKKVSTLFRDGKCNWIRQNQPDIWAKTDKYLQVSGFFNFRLTGEFKDSTASQIGHIPFNYKKIGWCKAFEPASMLFPVEREKLPKTVAPGELIGRLTASVAKTTGLGKGLPVIACGSDKGCETIGMGVIEPHMASLSFGTTATVQTTTNAYFETIPLMPPYPAPMPGRYNPEIEIFRGYWMITWFKNQLAHREVSMAKQKGTAPEAELDDLLRQSPAGAMGLIVQPFWGPGLDHPDGKGAMIGFGDVHTRAHIYRAVIEGLGYALRDGLQRIEKKGRIAFKKLAVSGGASQSDEICQISADIFNLPLVRGKTTETSGLGAAIVTAAGTGIHHSIDEAIEKMVHYSTEFRPNPDNVEIYAKLYGRVYRRLYHSLRPLYREIQDITGYPEK